MAEQEKEVLYLPSNIMEGRRHGTRSALRRTLRFSMVVLLTVANVTEDCTRTLTFLVSKNGNVLMQLV
jgi:hypothetical protein